MKTRELIARLQELDPGGEIECCIDNASITGVEIMPAYWDGKLQVFEPPHTVHFRSRGNKIVLKWKSMSDVMFGNPEQTVVTIDEGFGTEQKTDILKYVEQTRQEAKESLETLEYHHFDHWLTNVTGGKQWPVQDVKAFMNKLGISRSAPLKPGPASYLGQRHVEWGTTLEVTVRDGRLAIKRK